MKNVLVLISFALLAACADTAAEAEPDWDVAEDTPSGVDGKADTVQQPPIDRGEDAQPPTEVDLRSPADLSDWQMERSCRENFAEPPSLEPYSPRSGGSASRLTVSEFDLADADMPFLRVLPEERHGTAYEYSYDLHAVPGDDVILHVYAANLPREDSRFSITVLVDYQPVVAEFSYWRQDRGGLIDESRGTGFAHELVDELAIVDIVIPAENFEEGKLHEIGLAVNWPLHREIHYGDETRRFPLFYGGWQEPEDLPCSTKPAAETPNRFEADVLEPSRGPNHVGIFVDPMPTARTAHLHRFEAAPGEVVQVYATLFPRLDVEPDRVIVALPLLDGKPAGEARWLGQSGAEEIASIDSVFTHIEQTVNMRYAFEVTMPEEPGTYDLQVMTWADPYVRWRSIDAEPVYGFMNVTNGDHRAGSNVITFEVERAR